jgi:hypothetical protein
MKVDNLCAVCKGTKMLCGLERCPKLAKAMLQLEAAPKIKESMSGPSPPNMFVGSFNYPQVSWGPMIALDSGISDSPADWYGFSYDEIIRNRSMVVIGRKDEGIFSKSRMLEDTQEAAMSIRPVDMEAQFTRKPVYEMKFSSVMQPTGASAPLKELKVTDNTRIPKKVDELVDEGVKAVDAATELFTGGFDNYYITKLLTAGVLGRKDNRKLVPTRWGITATDDMLGKQMMEKIREFPQIEEFRVYSNEYLYNHFEVLLMPGGWEYEGFEAWSPSTIWGAGGGKFAVTEEYEPNWGRTTYADKQAGGYYAARFGVCEGLARMGRQARAIVFREIYEGYVLPVGVWEVRENARHALMNAPKKFGTLNDAIEHLKTRLRVPFGEYRKQSRILPQSRLTDF